MKCVLHIIPHVVVSTPATPMDAFKLRHFALLARAEQQSAMIAESAEELNACLHQETIPVDCLPKMLGELYGNILGLVVTTDSIDELLAQELPDEADDADFLDNYCELINSAFELVDFIEDNFIFPDDGEDEEDDEDDEDMCDGCPGCEGYPGCEDCDGCSGDGDEDEEELGPDEIAITIGGGDENLVDAVMEDDGVKTALSLLLDAISEAADKA